MKEKISVSTYAEKAFRMVIAAIVMLYNIGRVLVHLAGKTRNADKTKNIFSYSMFAVIIIAAIKLFIKIAPQYVLVIGSLGFVVVLLIAIFIASEIVGY